MILLFIILVVLLFSYLLINQENMFVYIFLGILVISLFVFSILSLVDIIPLDFSAPLVCLFVFVFGCFYYF